MKTTTVVFPEQDRVEVQQVEVDEVKANQVKVVTNRSLISTGTERKCLQQDFAPIQRRLLRRGRGN